MIDLHTHILPNIDDGAKDEKTSITMLQKEIQQGVSTVVFTPHYYGIKYSPERFFECRSEAFMQIKEQIPSSMDTRLGAEFHFTGINVLEYETLCKFAIEGTKYILFELPFATKWTGALLEKIAEFIDETEFTPIIAHVERYNEVLKNPSLINELVQYGCLIQVNAQAFMDKWEKSFVFALLKRGLVHCVGSDAHDLEGRAPCLGDVNQMLEKAGYGEEWKNAQNIMGKILADEKVGVTCGAPIKKFFGKFR